ncbi:MAG: bacillithiol biosynthesis deacetylase BshB1 [Saprospiraceae bacterium]|nr:bacillithiol biosynthesis deacetylase BshB1 [Saprospiraceae bacterium]
MKVDILAIGVHPDDIELSASGTIISHISQGYSVGLCDLTQGELGTRGSASLRLAEAEKSKQILGAKFRVNLGMRDGFFEYSEENIYKLVAVIRQHQPSIVLSNAISDRHPDHGRAAKLISDACFYSGLVKVKTTDSKKHNQAPWRPKAVYNYIQDRNLKADFVVDISPYMDKKLEAILAFNSQFFDPDSKEPETPISSKNFIEFIKSKNRSYGRDINVEFAEGFTVERNIGIKNLFNLI